MQYMEIQYKLLYVYGNTFIAEYHLVLSYIKENMNVYVQCTCTV